MVDETIKVNSLCLFGLEICFSCCPHECQDGAVLSEGEVNSVRSLGWGLESLA